MKPIPLTETQMAELFRLRKEVAELKRQLEESSKGALACANRILQQEQKIGSLHRQLAESQAREVKYRDALENYKILCQDENYYSHYVDVLKALAIPHDDTALNEYRDAVIEECAAVCKHFEEKADALNDSISDDDDPNEGRSEWIMGKAAAASRIGKAIQNLKEEK